MPFVRMMRMLSAMESGQLTGAQLDDLLAEPGRLGEFQVIAGDRALRARLYASQVTMAAVLESVTATEVAFAKNEWVAEFLAKPWVLSTAAGKMLLFNNGSMLLKIASYEPALSLVRAAPLASVLSWQIGSISSTEQAAAVTVAGGSYLLLGVSTDHSSSASYTFGTYVRGTSANASVPPSTGSSGASTTVAIALAGPVTAKRISGSGGTSNYLYARYLRCDI